MGIDFTGGLSVEREYVFAKAPTEPGMRDAVNMWLWDDSGWIGIPRVGVEAIAPDWDSHTLQATVVLADGRVLRNSDPGEAHSPFGLDGKPTILGAGPMSFACVEPFRRYVARYDGPVNETSYDSLLHRRSPTGKVALAYEIECETVAPPWVQGSMSDDAARMMSGTSEANFMGGDRLEQMLRATGTVTIDGVARPFSGGGLRVKRQGVRKVAGFWGHCWQSALFPSGRAFGYIAYPPRPDGAASYNEGYVFLGDGKIVPARVARAPFLTGMQFSGEDASLELETRDGTIRIGATTMMSIPSLSTGAPQKMVDGINFPPLLQSIVRYEWDGEVGYGMMERSNLRENVSGIPE
jgi:hypothetical protein